MTSHRFRAGTAAGWGARRRVAGCHAASVLAYASLAIASAGCGAPVTHVRLPATSVGAPAYAGPSVSASVPVPTRQQVLAALIGYTTALGQAAKSRSSTLARELLRPYLVPNRIAGVVQAMAAIWARGESFTGKDVLHVSSVTVAGRHAFVHNCDNTSGMALVNIATGQVVPGSSGLVHANLLTRLDLVSGHWLVQFQVPEDVPCVA
ncbi:MAG TPA: hypothetical protein VLM11_12315 [Streptosporangiaceae bacterium]|nr:hypothetical protein [Streptosporangiaceae bacterium]